MTERQKEKARLKISQIKKALAAEKREWGGYYRDGGGYRYLPPELYIKLEDYKGALRYFRWFQKNFPDDIGYPTFLFEWTITLFKTGNLKDATKKAFETFVANTYLFDKFFSKEFLEFDKQETSNWQMKETADYLIYSFSDPKLEDFSTWLEAFTKSKAFLDLANAFIEIRKEIKITPVGEKRGLLIEAEKRLISGL